MASPIGDSLPLVHLGFHFLPGSPGYGGQVVLKLKMLSSSCTKAVVIWFLLFLIVILELFVGTVPSLSVAKMLRNASVLTVHNAVTKRTCFLFVFSSGFDSELKGLFSFKGLSRSVIRINTNSIPRPAQSLICSQALSYRDNFIVSYLISQY